MILLMLAALAGGIDHPVSAVEAAVVDRLIDGESARWRWFPPRTAENGEVTYCGFLNAKNRLGGYSGFNPVWITGTWSGDRFIPSNVEFAQGPYLDGIAARQCIAVGYDMRSIPAR